MKNSWRVYGICEGCRKYRWFIKTLVIDKPGIGRMTSQSLLCWTCRKRIKTMAK